MSDKVMIKRADLEAVRAGIVDFRMDHPHVVATDGLDRAEELLAAALAPASSERAAAGVLDLLPRWEAWRAKWWTRADEERSQYALGVTAALGDCLDDLRRVLDIPEDEPAPAPAVAE